MRNGNEMRVRKHLPFCELNLIDDIRRENTQHMSKVTSIMFICSFFRSRPILTGYGVRNAYSQWTCWETITVDISRSISSQFFFDPLYPQESDVDAVGTAQTRHW